MNMEGKKIVKPDDSRLGPVDRWVLSKLNRVISEVTENMEKFELGIAVSKVYDFMFTDEGAGLNFIFIFFMGIVYGIMLLDYIGSVGLFVKISKFSKESGILERYEAIKEKWEDISKETKNKLFKGRNKTLLLNNNKIEAIKQKIAEAVYIDPEKEKNKSSNYDESGRPIKDDTEQ